MNVVCSKSKVQTTNVIL